MKHAHLFLLLLLALTACDGAISGSPPGTPPPVDPPIDPPDAGPAKCEPGVHEVPNLLRLSNHEYQAMVRDLLGVPVSDALFTQWTPVAQVYGFDTMSETRIDAQSLEVQLATAEALAGIVLATPSLTAHCPAPLPPQTPACTLKPTYSSIDDFSDAQGRDCWTYLDSSGVPMIFDNANARWRKEPDQTVLLWRVGAHPGSTVDAVRRWLSPVDGNVAITGHFNDADPGGGDGILAVINKNGTQVFARDLPNGGQGPFSLNLPVAKGDTIDFVVNRKTNPNYDSTAFSASISFSGIPRKNAWAWANCVEPLVSRLASRAFRRPVRADELADYQTLFASSLQGATAAGFPEPVDEALEAVLEAVFLSPNFVFKPELVPGGLDPSERGFGVASRLSLFFRGSLADEQLWTLAGLGQLSEPSAVRAQATRLLEQDLDRFTSHFGGQWLDFRDGTVAHPLEASMKRESRDMFAAVLREDRPPEQLLRPGFTVVQGALAQYYGLPGSGMDETTYRFMTPLRGGLLSHAFFLTRTGSGSEFRRPIHRGIWVLTRLLCRPLPRLDPATLEEIGNSFNTIDRTKPLPEQMALHRDSSTRCGACHASIDPIGLALEKFDQQGQWRETYADGKPIVSELELDGVTVRDPYELAEALEANPDYRACVAEKLLTFGMNRGPLEEEQCVAERLGRPLDGSQPTLKTMTVDALMKALELTEVSP
ncbi:MAG: DUF1588 domain-containing protein [Myxococcota bacterium]